jgi:ribonuclease BN (tRNA processing enzyme)
MKITVLGRWGAYPEAGEATAGYLLQTDKHKVLLDCGSGVLANLFRHIRPEELDAVFLSHFHYDHCADLGCLLYTSKFAMVFKKRLKPLPVFANKKRACFSKLSFNDYTIEKEINPEKMVDIDGLQVSFYPTVHEEYNLAMRFEYNGKVLVYTGDLGPATRISDFCKNADLIICEASLFAHEEGLFPGHMTTKEAAQLASDSKARSLLLTHFPHVGEINNLALEAARYFKGMILLAEINKTFQI